MLGVEVGTSAASRSGPSSSAKADTTRHQAGRLDVQRDQGDGFQGSVRDLATRRADARFVGWAEGVNKRRNTRNLGKRIEGSSCQRRFWMKLPVPALPEADFVSTGNIVPCDGQLRGKLYI